MGQRYLIVLALVVSLSAIGSPAVAESGEDPIEMAKDAFSKGSKLFADGKFVEAAAEFRRAMALAPSWKIYYNIAHSEAAAKNYGLALEAFQMYLAEAGDAIPADREEEVINQIRDLKAKVGSVKVTAPEGAVVLIDGMKRGVAPMLGSMKVSAGKYHQVQVTLGEDVLLEQTVRVWAEEELALEAKRKEDAAAAPTPAPVPAPVPATEPPVTAAPAPVAVEPVQPPPPVATDVSSPSTTAPVTNDGLPVVQTVEQKHPLRITGAILLTVGAVGLAGGAASGIFTAIKARQLKDNCEDNICTTEDDEQSLNLAKKMALVTTIQLPVGGVLAATGLTLLIVGRRLERKGMHALAPQPILAPDFVGMTLTGRF